MAGAKRPVETRDGRKKQRRALERVSLAAAAVTGALWAIEVFLVKSSEYRLSHGDGRERSFRGGSAPSFSDAPKGEPPAVAATVAPSSSPPEGDPPAVAEAAAPSSNVPEGELPAIADAVAPSPGNGHGGPLALADTVAPPSDVPEGGLATVADAVAPSTGNGHGEPQAVGATVAGSTVVPAEGSSAVGDAVAPSPGNGRGGSAMAIDLLRRSDEPPAAPPRGQASEPVFPKRPSPIGILRVLPALAGLVLGIVTLSKASAASIGPYGLIQALPKGYFVALGLVLISFPLTWSRRRPSRIEFAIEVVILVFLLEAAPSIIEAAPRFPSAWLIAGFSDYIARTGRVLPLVDARFSWPSMMAGAALLARVAGVRSTVEFLRWFPLFINLLYLPPLFLIAKTILRNEKYAMLVTWLFPLANWVGQDYFSPQAVTFLLLLVLVYIVLGPFRARLPWLWRPAPYDHVDERGPVDGRAGLVLLGALTVLTLAMASGHQLTPAFAILFVFLFALTGRTRLRVFPALMLVITMGWICYGAVAFWAGHTGKVFGRIGKFASNVTTSTTARIAGSHAHHLVTTSRVLAAFMIWGLGILGFLVARRARIDRLTALVMLASPFVVLLGQDYGGEGGLRVYLASLPGALCLTAALFAWRPRARGELTAEDGAGHDGYFGATVRGIAVLVLSAVMVPTFLVARWGNELYEQVRPGEVSGVEALYRLAPPGSVLLAMDSHLPWRTVSLTDYKYIVSRYDEFETMDISGLAKALSETPKGGFIIITTAQIQYEEQVAGLPSSWNAAFTKALLGSGKFKRVFTNANTQIYQYTGAISGG